jgi:hypothetical protein
MQLQLKYEKMKEIEKIWKEKRVIKLKINEKLTKNNLLKNIRERKNPSRSKWGYWKR